MGLGLDSFSCVYRRLKGTWDVDADTDALIARRRTEVAAAASRIHPNATVHFLEAIDGELTNTVEQRGAVLASFARRHLTSCSVTTPGGDGECTLTTELPVFSPWTPWPQPVTLLPPRAHGRRTPTPPPKLVVVRIRGA